MNEVDHLQNVPAEEEGEEDGRGRLGGVLPPHHGCHLQ